MIFIFLAISIALRLIPLLQWPYFVLGMDSHYFHWMAANIAAGEPGTWRESGIAPIVGYAGSVIGVDVASAIIPITLSLLMAMALYFPVRKLAGKGVALCSVAAWAIMLHPVYLTSAGYLDRDGEQILLLWLASAMLLLSAWARWFWKIGATIAVLGITAALEYSWSWVAAPVVGLVILSGIAGMAAMSVRRPEQVPSIMLFATLAAAGAVLAFQFDDRSVDILSYVSGDAVSQPFRELSPIGWREILLQYNYWIIPFGIGFYRIVKSWHPLGGYCAGWFCGMAVLAAVAAQRCIVLAVPAIVVICGFGLAEIIRWAGDVWARCSFDRWIWRAGIAVCAVAVIVSGVGLWRVSLTPTLHPDPGWQSALEYLRDETPPGARVVTWWDRGYWVLDIADREPVTQSSESPTDASVARAYCAETLESLQSAMESLDAQYIISSWMDERISSTIVDVAGVDVEWERSLVRRIRMSEVAWWVRGSGLDVMQWGETTVIKVR